MVSYNTFKAEQGQRQAAEHLKSGKEFYRQKEWNQAKLEAENCLERSPGLKECAKLLTSSQIALDREWAREQAAEERAARLAERTVSIDWSESAFEDFWFAVSGNYYVSDDEFENKKRERSALKNQREALKKTYSFTVPEVDVSDFDFRRKRFVISLPGLMGTPYRGENYISFQRVNSVSGDYYFSAMWVMQNASRLRRPSAEIKFSSEEDARDWRDSNTSIVAEVSNCRIGTEWEIGGYATKISGVYLKGCVVTFKNEITDEILAEVRM